MIIIWRYQISLCCWIYYEVQVQLVQIARKTTGNVPRHDPWRRPGTHIIAHCPIITSTYSMQLLSFSQGNWASLGLHWLKSCKNNFLSPYKRATSPLFATKWHSNNHNPNTTEPNCKEKLIGSKWCSLQSWIEHWFVDVILESTLYVIITASPKSYNIKRNLKNLSKFWSK